MTSLFFIRGFIPLISQKENHDFSDFKKELDAFILFSKNSSYEFSQLEDTSLVQKELFNFDPNTASKQELLKLGFSNKTVNTIKKYINAGGRFYGKKDMLKIYGLNKDRYNDLESYIIIKKESQVERINNKTIDLNSSDSTELMKLSGIGQKLANRIIKYRNLLGGYVIKNQLLEVYGIKPELYENIKERIIVDSLFISKIDINFAGFKEILKHPYFDYNSVKKIINFRSKNGMFLNIYELNTSDLLNDSIYKKVYGYIKIGKKFE